MKYKISLVQIFLIPIVLLIFTNCSFLRKSDNQLIQNDLNDHFQTIWVDPQIITSDSLITLIRADRIDSMEVSPGQQLEVRSTSIEIPITISPCNVSVSLLDSNMTFIHPLLVRKLNPGFYRLTFSPNRLKMPILPQGRYLLKADFCGNTSLAYFSVEENKSMPSVQ